MAAPQPLTTISNSRQNLVNQAPLYPGSALGGSYDERGVNVNMSFSMSQGSQGGGSMMMQQPGGPFRSYESQNGNVHALSQQRRNSAPQIYSAVYSNVNVYEMEVNGVAVMRRRRDSWLNATQILKVAGIEKGKRTKVLEKEILIGEHEKVQGGYGKYQGTWITFDRGLEFCRQYGVEELLRPLLTYDMGHDGNVPGRGGGVDTPTKEQAMAAQRKKLYNSSVENRGIGQTGTFFKNISSTASHAVAAISKARFDSPGPRMRNNPSNSRPASFSRQSSSQQIMGSQESAYPGGSQQSMASYASEGGYQNGLPDSAYSTQIDNRNEDFEEPPRKKVRQSNDMGMNDHYYDTSMREPSPTIANESFYQNQHLGDDVGPLGPLPAPESDYGQSKIHLLLSLFQNASREDFSTHEVFTQLKPEDLDLPIDNSANNAIIWAATLARIPLLKQLIAKGASMFRVNKTGETALMRSCVVTNNLDHSSFPDLLELLGPTLDVRDARGRTVLHHIAITSAVKGRSQASKYYLESLLEFVVRQGPTSRQSFGHFISEIINIQDRSGDTALNVASRIGNRSIISQLLEVGADSTIPNRSGLSPQDFGVGGPPGQQGTRDETRSKPLAGEPKESSSDIIGSITKLLQQTEADFTAEITSKKQAIDKIHQQLRDTSAQLGEQRRKFEAELAESKIRDTRKLKISNLTPAINEERTKLERLQQSLGQPVGVANGIMQIGDADDGLSIPATSQAGQILSTIDLSTQSLDPNSHALLDATLPPASVLRARLAAYKSNNTSLEDGVKALQSKSSELAAKYRVIIGLCTQTEESKVDGVLSSLLRAVESEQGVELGRVRDFLVRVGEDS